MMFDIVIMISDQFLIEKAREKVEKSSPFCNQKQLFLLDCSIKYIERKFYRQSNDRLDAMNREESNRNLIKSKVFFFFFCNFLSLSIEN